MRVLNTKCFVHFPIWFGVRARVPVRVWPIADSGILAVVVVVMAIVLPMSRFHGMYKCM